MEDYFSFVKNRSRMRRPFLKIRQVIMGDLCEAWYGVAIATPTQTIFFLKLIIIIL
jgi:hypothetical protein